MNITNLEFYYFNTEKNDVLYILILSKMISLLQEILLWEFLENTKKNTLINYIKNSIKQIYFNMLK